MFDDYMVRFRRKVESEAITSAKISDIIAQSTSKTEVFIEGNENAIPVAFINKSKESGTESIMYTYVEDKVAIGNYIKFLNDWYLVYSEIKNIKRTDYINAFRLLNCNVSFNINGSLIKAYFRGALRSAGSDESNLADNLGITSLGEAYVILPTSSNIERNTTYSIGSKGWRVTTIDDITNSGITYAALEEDQLIDVTKLASTETELPTVVIDTTPELLAGITNTLSTENGYITANRRISITSRTANEVKFTIDFGVEDITIETKSEGEIVSTYYKVRG